MHWLRLTFISVAFAFCFLPPQMLPAFTEYQLVSVFLFVQTFFDLFHEFKFLGLTSESFSIPMATNCVRNLIKPSTKRLINDRSVIETKPITELNL